MSRQEITSSAETPIYWVSQRVPYVEDLLTFSPKGITKNDYQQLIARAQKHVPSFLFTQTTRRIDRSGLIVNLADVAKTPSEASVYLTIIMTKSLRRVHALDKDTRTQVFNLLAENKPTPDALCFLDQEMNTITESLKKYRGIQYAKLRQSIVGKIQNPDIKYISNFNGPATYDLELTDDVNTKQLTYIQEQYSIDPLPQVINQQIKSITPDFLLRENTDSYSIDTIPGFAREIGKVGNPAVRELALLIRSWEKINQYDTIMQQKLDPLADHIRDRA